LFLSTTGTLPVAPTGFVETTEPVVIVPEFKTIDNNRISGQLNTKTQVTDTCMTKTSFDVIHTMRTSNVLQDALDTPPGYGLLLQVAGFDEIVDAVTPGEESVTYVNNVDAINNFSAVSFMDDQKFTMTNSLASGLSIDMKVGEIAKITNNVQGFLDSATPTEELNPVITLSSEKALVVSCADIMTFDGACLPLENVSIKMNEDIQELYTMGGACGLKTNFVSDYALELTADFYVDSTTFGREASNIETGNMKEIIVKIGLDETSTEINGKSVVLTMELAKTTVYTDSIDKDLLKRSVTFRLMDGANPALSIKTGFFN